MILEILIAVLAAVVLFVVLATCGLFGFRVYVTLTDWKSRTVFFERLANNHKQSLEDSVVLIDNYRDERTKFIEQRDNFRYDKDLADLAKYEAMEMVAKRDAEIKHLNKVNAALRGAAKRRKTCAPSK